MTETISEQENEKPKIVFTKICEPLDKMNLK